MQRPLVCELRTVEDVAGAEQHEVRELVPLLTQTTRNLNVRMISNVKSSGTATQQFSRG